MHRLINTNEVDVIFQSCRGGDLVTGLYEQILDIEPTLTIPDNPTNGDMIKALFPNVESRLDDKTGIMLVKWVDGTTKTYKASWWNAPYTGIKE